MSSLHCGSGTRVGHLIPLPSYLSKVAGASEMKQIVRRTLFAVDMCSSKGTHGDDRPSQARQKHQLPGQVRLKGLRARSATFARKSDAARWAGATETHLREARHFPESVPSQHTVSAIAHRGPLVTLHSD